jgi:uncharacterized membrane-anchored protein YitT (DUF2179 family)
MIFTKKITKKIAIDYLYITIGTFLLGFAVIAFWQPHNLVTGGISGLAIIIFHYTESAGFQIPIPIWLSNLVLNLPLFIVGFKVMPKEYFVRSIYGYLMLTISLYVLRFVPQIPSDLLMASLFGGVIAGVGISFVLRALATTGGSTLIAAILNRWAFRHISTAKILFFVDSAIILIGLLVFGPIAAMYAVVAVFVSTKVTDAAIDGLSFSKAAFIISHESDAIADRILKDMDRGVTEMPSRGRYTQKEQTMLLCVVPAKEIVNLKQIVYETDKNAFVIVTDVREVLGEGFKAGEEN